MEGLSIATVILVILNIVGVAFSYGRLTEKVNNISKSLNDLSHRIERLENNRERVGR